MKPTRHGVVVAAGIPFLALALLGNPLIAGQASADDPYPLSHQLRTLEQDVGSADYRVIVDAMIPTDLEAEWKRVGTADNYHLFVKQHGGEEKIAQDPALRKAYERRKRIATQFLELMRAAYEKRKRPPPFADPAALAKTLESADRKGDLKQRHEIPVRAILPAPGAEKQWPGFRGPTGRGIVADMRIPMRWSATQNVVWKAKLPGRGSSSPVVWDNRLFVTSEGPAALTQRGEKGPERLLLCYDRRDGKLLWQEAAPRPQELERLYGKNNFAVSTPVTDGERVIVFFGNGGMLCCDVDGRRQWHQDLGTFPTQHGPGATPVLYKDLVIVIQDQTEGKSLCAAFDKRTGAPRWRRERKNNACWSTPVLLRIEDRDELVYNGSHEVISYAPATGEELWKAAGTTKESVPMIAAGGGLLFSTSGRGGPTLAIRPGGRGDVTETHVVWRLEQGGPHVPSPAYHDGRLFLMSDPGVLTCLEAATGNTVYQQRLRGWFSMSPLVIGEMLLLVNEKGVATLVKAGEAFEVLAENDLGETVLATPAVLDRRIYFRTAEHLICIGETSGDGK